MRRVIFWFLSALVVVWTAAICSAVLRDDAQLGFLSFLFAWAIFGAPLALFAYLAKPRNWQPVRSPKQRALVVIGVGLLAFFIGATPKKSTVSSPTQTVVAPAATVPIPTQTAVSPAETVPAPTPTVVSPGEIVPAPALAGVEKSHLGTNELLALKALAQERVAQWLSPGGFFRSVWISENPPEVYVCGRVSGYSRLEDPPLPVTRFMAHRTEATSKSAAGPLVANLDVNNSRFDADWQSWCAPSAPAQDEAMDEYHGTHGPMGDAPDYSIQGDFTYHFLDD